MKKILAIMMFLLYILSFSKCGKNDNNKVRKIFFQTRFVFCEKVYEALIFYSKSTIFPSI